MMTELSIIVPMYNGKATIQRCLDSLIAQTLQEIEILVVDDGSTDGGAEIVRLCMEQDARIRIVSSENRGLGAARNLGIRSASGEFVGFVDCDDYVAPEMFENMLSALRRTGCPVAVCQEKNVYVEDGERKLIGETHFPVSGVTALPTGKLLDWLLNYTYMSLNCAWSKVVRKELFFRFGIWFPENYRHAEDVVTSVGIFSSVERAAVVPESLYCYVHRKGSLSYAYSLKHAEDIYQDWQEIRGYLDRSGYRGTLDNFSLGMSFASLKQFCRTADSVNKQERERVVSLWENARREGKWRPRFLKTQVPFVHKVKILAAWLRLVAPAMKVLELLQWIPFFRYMS